jgi:hypothetical protein
MFDLTQLAINLRKAGFSALDVADGVNSQGWIVGFGTTLDGRINAFLAIPVGVTADPPGGPDAPTPRLDFEKRFVLIFVSSVSLW